MSAHNRRMPPPWWFTAIILILIVPILSLPAMLSSAVLGPQGELRTLAWLFPGAMLTAGWCAWASYRERPTVAWLMAAVMLAVDAAMIYLFFLMPPASYI